MGGFDVSCSLSGLPLSGPTLLLLVEDGVPVTLPLYGVYDGSGGIDIVRGSVTTDALWSLERTSGHASTVDLEDLSQILHGEFVGENWAKGSLDALLIHGDLYSAIVATVLSGECEKRADVQRSTLEAMPMKQLFSNALPRAESKKVYDALTSEQLAEIRAELIDLLAFRQWPGELERRTCEDQYYSDSDLAKSSSRVKEWLTYDRISTVVNTTVTAWKEEYGEDED